MSSKLLYKQLLFDLLMFLFLCISGNPVFNQGLIGKSVFLIMLLVLLAICNFKITMQCWKTMLFWVIFLVVIFFFQLINLGHITWLGSANFIVKMLCAILFAFLMGDRLRSSALRVMFVICLISFIFYPFNLVGIRFPEVVDIHSKSESLIIYTQTWLDEVTGIYRNSGMFWEPGAFAGYIISVLLLYIDRLDELWTQHRVKTIVLLMALLTTLSTTGYIVLALLIVYFATKYIRRKKLAIVISFFLLIAFVSVFTQLDFLGAKIQDQIENAETINDLTLNYSRIGSVLFDAEYIAANPLFGNGLDNSTRFRFHTSIFDNDQLSGFGNGFTGCVASMGLIFMIAYLLSIFNNPSLRSRWIVLLVVILLLQGEYFLNYPFFMLFPFVDFGSVKREKINRIKFVWKRAESHE